MATEFANPLYGARMTSRAILGVVPSRQHQTKLRLTRAAWLAAASLKQTQDWPASCRAGLLSVTNLLNTCPGLRGSGLSRNSHRQVSSPCRRPLRFSRCIGHNSPGRAVTMAAPGAFHSTHSTACRRLRAQSVGHQQTVNIPADVPHFQALSSSAAFAGSQTSEALNGRVPNFTGAFHKNEGELPNVCC